MNFYILGGHRATSSVDDVSQITMYKLETGGNAAGWLDRNKGLRILNRTGLSVRANLGEKHSGVSLCY